jgi:hypothetical protein
MLEPIRVHSVEGLIGHILVNFLAVISYMKLNSYFNNKYCAMNALLDLGYLIGKRVSNQIFVSKPSKSMKKYLDIFNVDIPRIIDISSKNSSNNNVVTP